MISHFVDNALIATETDRVGLEGIEGIELLTQPVNISQESRGLSVSF